MQLSSALASSVGTDKTTARIFQIVILDRSGAVEREVFVRAATVIDAASIATRGEELCGGKKGKNGWLRAKVYFQGKRELAMVRLFSAASQSEIP